MSGHLMQNALGTILAICVMTSLPTSTVNAQAQQCDECDECGEEIACKKVCCLKCDFIEVKFTCYKSEYEDFCVPCMSTKCGERCVSGCSCKDGSDSCGQKKVFGIWQPNGAEVKSRRRLKFKTMTKKVPSFKWEVQSRCHACCQNCMSVPNELPGELPALPEGVEVIDISQVEAKAKQQVKTKTQISSKVSSHQSAQPVRQTAPVKTPPIVSRNSANSKPAAVVPPIVSSESIAAQQRADSSFVKRGFAPRVAESTIEGSSSLKR